MKMNSLKKLISILLVLSTLVLFCVPAFAAENEKPNKIDVVFLIETTKNIEKEFQDIITSIRTIIQNLDKNGIDYRAAVVDYRDVPSRTTDRNDYSFKSSSFMTDSDTIFTYLNLIKLSKVNSTNSCLFSAIIDGTKKLSFRSDCIKSYFVFGTTPCYDPEPDTGYSVSVVRKLYSLSSTEAERCPYKFFSYNFGNNDFTDRYFSLLANESCGNYHKLNNSVDLANDITNNLSNDFTKIIYEVSMVPSKPDIDDQVDDIINNAPEFLRGLLRYILRIYVIIWKLMF